jgi:hypothetical protein
MQWYELDQRDFEGLRGLGVHQDPPAAEMFVRISPGDQRCTEMPLWR